MQDQRVDKLFRRLLCLKPPPPRPEMAPVCIGLTGAGKTTVLTLLSGQSTDDIKPTTGFEIKAAQFKKFILNIKEIGGGEKVRPYWKHYYAGARGVVFVVDSAASDDELDVAAQELLKALSNPMLHSEPCLVLCNCQDKDGARNTQELTRLLDVELACEGRQWMVHACSRKDVKSIREAFEKFGDMLLPKDGATAAQEPSAENVNRI